MKKFTDYIIKLRYLFLSLFIFLSIFSIYLSTKVSINEDITKYLPSTSDVKTGIDIMDEVFSKQASSYLNVMFKDLSDDEKKDTLEELEKIDGVSYVSYEDTDEYNKDGYTLYVLNVSDYSDSETATKVFKYVNKNFNIVGVDGNIYEENKPVLELWIVIVAILCAMIILIVLSESYIEPWLYLFAMGMAVFINKGTNIMFDDVSSITNSIVAILQLALSMDYSIMLSNRYREEKKNNSNKVDAMKIALYNSFKSILSSSVTTIVGLLALVFMSFTIGRDLGFVLAKGVLLSLICIIFCLPALLLMFDDLIIKTHKKSFKFNLNSLGEFIYKTRYIQSVFIIILFIVAFFLKGNVSILYTDSEKDKVRDIFPVMNQIAIVYNNKYEELVSNYCKKLEEDENIDRVLCYSNTINEKLAYNELNQKVKELGQSIRIDDYLIKMIYYDYYSKDINNTMTLSEFISFIKSDIYTNGTFNKFIDQDIKDNLELLENFSDASLIYKNRTTDEIADILGMSREDAANILIYYNSLYLDTRMSINEFVSFILNEVVNDPSYSSYFNLSITSKLKQLQYFTDTSIINKKMDSNELSNVFGIDKDLIEQLFVFYRITTESKTKMTLNQFAKFTLELSSQDDYKSMFNESIIKSLNILLVLSDDEFVTNELDLDTMRMYLNNFGLSLDNELLLLYIYYTGYNTETKLTVGEFSSIALDMSEQELYKEYFNDDVVDSLETLQNLSLYYDTLLSNNKLYEMFGIDSITGLGLTYIITGSPFRSYSMTPLDFVNTLLSNDTISSMLNDNQKTSLELAQYVMINIDTTYSVFELSNLLSQDETIISFVYGVYDYQSNNLKNISITSLINFLYDNKSNPILSSKLESFSSILEFGYLIVNNTMTLYNYNDISNITGVEASQINQIFGVYDYLNYNMVMTPLELTDLILNNIDNELLSDKVSISNINDLNFVRVVMISTINNIYYSSSDVSSLIGINNNLISLLFSLYDSKYIKSHQEMSLIDYVDFMIENVMNNKDYSSKFSNTDREKLITIDSMMYNSLNGIRYDVDNLFNNLKVLTGDLNKNLIELVYLYYGSVNQYDDSWKLTVEEFINYLSSNILNDSRIKDYVNFMIKNKINSTKRTINNSKDLIVSDNYSRVVLDTKYSLEDNAVFELINSIYAEFGDNEDIYVVGDSAMAVELSKSFKDELNKITILLMIFIFIVVAIAFKDLLIPLILVLTIQTAVYITMSFISVTGGSVYFIAILVVQAILMGATIDYAIVYTSYYREARLTMSVKNSIINAYNRSIHTIMCSSLILIFVTLVVASFASAIASKICETISQGTFVSLILILFLLPGVLATTDKLVCRSGYYDEKNKK